MSTNTHIENHKRIADDIIAGRLFNALTQLRALSENAMMWEVTSSLDNAADTYRYMLDYLISGTNDAQRGDIYDDIRHRLLVANDSILRRRTTLANTSSLYYDTVRTLQSSRVRTSISQCVNNITALEADSKSTNTQLLDASRMLFERVWVTFPLDSDDANALARFIADIPQGDDNHIAPATIRAQALYAVLLGQLEFFDERRLRIMADVYAGCEDSYINALALTALCISLLAAKNRPIPAKTRHRIEALTDRPSWQSDLITTFRELIRTRDTERITRHIRQDVMPDIMRMRPDIMRKMKETEESLDPTISIDENPEWEELLRESGIADRMKEMTEMQMDGDDVFMSTFGDMKHFPFFHQLLNWFVPFDKHHTAIASLPEQVQTLAPVLSQALMLCDSDKYSLILSLQHMPESQMNMISSQIEAQKAMLAEADQGGIETLLPQDRRRRYTANILQSMNRFYKHFRRKNEFADPFDGDVNLCTVPLLAPSLTDAQSLEVIAAHFFKTQSWNDAITLYTLLNTITAPDESRHQKTGYAYEKLGNISAALEAYRHADIINPESTWTLGRLAILLRRAGKYAEAVDTLSRLSMLKADDADVALQYGYALTEMERYNDAISQFFKANYLRSAHAPTWRALAWVLFLVGRFDDSARYFELLINANPTAEDYLNMGHLSLARGNMREAINYYGLSLANSDAKTFVKAIESDRVTLASSPIDQTLWPLIIDIVTNK